MSTVSSTSQNNAVLQLLQAQATNAVSANSATGSTVGTSSATPVDFGPSSIVSLSTGAQSYLSASLSQIDSNTDSEQNDTTSPAASGNAAANSGAVHGHHHHHHGADQASANSETISADNSNDALTSALGKTPTATE